MRKNELHKFLTGELNIKQIQNEFVDNSVEKDFIYSYQKTIDKKNTEIPDFNPFKKIESVKMRWLSNLKRITAYAATILLLISLYVVYQEIQPFNKQNSLSAQELNELKINTEQSLLMFSKELNTCIAEIKKTQKARQPLTEMNSINHFKFEFDNPIKNIKIN
jgi:hypothetical protein